eukprot:CAMPEP_0202720418 /NCGR_PEP_ID=MMETSP1385-20130828/139789_1 /ASSEMBLY_ACC=CAM_ASM_000861 /TAXON_ID=933848 /ORGANISM="Elphidium margaritaceum" /LENGTH=86 /DNA_ID=CAMNT_0049384145 /DNA_START=31 /DNA_END=287 /DNA_ORIENTATION=-
MNPLITSSQMYFSRFIMALMEDSGWYVPNYAYAEPYYFGRDAGCAFFSGACTAFPQWYCASSINDGCMADYSAPGICAASTGTSSS